MCMKMDACLSHFFALSLADNSHLRQSDRFDDLIPGKGGGVVILLHGPPGVGKTLTAGNNISQNPLL